MFRTALMTSACVAAADIGLVSFDGADGTTFKFQELNDPVMGGKSTGTFSVDPNGFGVFDGNVVDVPALKAPGFIKAAADGKFAKAGADVTGDLVLQVRSSTPEYTGFRVAFASGTLSPSYACAGGGGIPFSRGCFKNKFTVPATQNGEFAIVRVPFNTFSDKWSSATGEQTATCADEADVCPTTKTLDSILRIEVWAEGVAGKAHLEIKSIYAESKPAKQMASQPVRPPAGLDQCSAAVQNDLRYGMSGRITADGLPIYIEGNESLATAVCCDKRALPYAEPRFTYQAPDILLYSKMSVNGMITVFYDSVCGVPLFQTPVNRTMDEFKADTDEHGWPSFRPAEVFFDNVITDKKTGYVTSSCGTHLGSFLPDEQGDRWCIDLSCISGNRA